MVDILNILLFFLFVTLLVASGALLVRSLLIIIRFLKLPEFVIGFVIMGIATTIPELFIGITSALKKTPEIILGTVIGSNVVDLTFIVAVSIILVKGITIKSRLIRRDAIWMFFIVLLPVILIFIGKKLSRWDGFILIAVSLFYYYYLIKRGHKHHKLLTNMDEKLNRFKVFLAFIVFVSSLVLIYYSADQTVIYAHKLAFDLALPEILIAIIFLALGTSLPELVFQTRAALTGHSELALGDVIGSVVNNSSIVLGISALINPIITNFNIFLLSSLFMIIITFIFATFLESGSKLSWKEGVALMLLYLFFVILEFMVLPKL